MFFSIFKYNEYFLTKLSVLINVYIYNGNDNIIYMKNLFNVKRYTRGIIVITLYIKNCLTHYKKFSKS